VIQLYVKRIRAGLMTIDDVPQRWRKAVEEALKE
jgi:hypothetical protein